MPSSPQSAAGTSLCTSSLAILSCRSLPRSSSQPLRATGPRGESWAFEGAPHDEDESGEKWETHLPGDGSQFVHVPVPVTGPSCTMTLRRSKGYSPNCAATQTPGRELESASEERDRAPNCSFRSQAGVGWGCWGFQSELPVTYHQLPGCHGCLDPDGIRSIRFSTHHLSSSLKGTSSPGGQFGGIIPRPSQELPYPALPTTVPDPVSVLNASCLIYFEMHKKMRWIEGWTNGWKCDQVR